MAIFPDTPSPGAPTISKRRGAQKRTATRQSQRAAKVAQPTLILAPVGAEEKFLAFHRANPDIYEAFKRVSLGVYRKGRTHWGAAAAFEVLRYEAILAGKMDEAERYGLNNDYRSRYARMFLAEYHNHAVLSRFFEIRALRSV